jgi:LysM repeat protein
MMTCPSGIFLYSVRPGDTTSMIARRFGTDVGSIAAVNPGTDLDNLHVGRVIRVRLKNSFHPAALFCPQPGISKSEADLSKRLRLLWEQHVVWTRLFIISAVFGLPDGQPVTNRLLRNPEDFRAALKPLYGEKTASRFADLLRSHLVIASELVKAAKAGDTKAAEKAEKDWYANADEIAKFLGSINPFWSAGEWRKMLHEHLALTKAEAVNILSGKYEDGISTFDKIEQQALEMADVMTEGIVKQFPSNFA